MHITKENINKFIYGTTIDCSNKNITYIEYIPDYIKYLSCDDNKLTKLPILPESLINLDCDNNNLHYEVTIDNIKEHNKLIRRKQILSKICV